MCSVPTTYDLCLKVQCETVYDARVNLTVTPPPPTAPAVVSYNYTVVPLNAALPTRTYSCATPNCFGDPFLLVAGQNYSVTVVTTDVNGSTSIPTAPKTFIACYIPEECWGWSSSGQLGVNNTLTYAPMGPPVVSLAPRWTRYWVADSKSDPGYVLAIQANDSTLWGWGAYPKTDGSPRAPWGQTGPPYSYVDPPKLLPVSLFPGMTWKSSDGAIAFGISEVFALHTNGSMFSWGYDYYELVYANSDFVMHGLYNMGGNWSKIAHSGYGDVICGLRTDYKIMCAGPLCPNRPVPEPTSDACLPLRAPQVLGPPGPGH